MVGLLFILASWDEMFTILFYRLLWYDLVIKHICHSFST
jgi:hypothetical protein